MSKADCRQNFFQLFAYQNLVNFTVGFLQLKFHYFCDRSRILFADPMNFFIDSDSFLFVLCTNESFLQCIHLFLRDHIPKEFVPAYAGRFYIILSFSTSSSIESSNQERICQASLRPLISL